MSYGFGNLHWAAAHVASMAGAFCAGVAVYGFRATSDDVPGWQVCIVLTVHPIMYPYEQATAYMYSATGARFPVALLKYTRLTLLYICDYR